MPDQDSIQQLLTEATAHYHSGQYREAIQVWRQVLSLEPGNQRATEGIRMASLLLEEAQDAVRANPEEPETPAESGESAGNIARVREGIQKVQELLAASRHMEALETCKSLLALAPQSAAVHEILDEAREACEAQPFINEHLEMARELFVQERLDEASTELHKIFFLNPYHVEAKKLEGKILALKQKRVPGSAPSADPPAPPEAEPELPEGEEAGQVPAEESARPQQRVAPPDFGDAIDLPQESQPESPAPESPAETVKGPEAGPAAPPVSDEGAPLSENWEAELAQLDLRAPGSSPATQQSSEAVPPSNVEGERMETVDISESPVVSAARPEAGSPGPAGPSAGPQGKSGRDLDLSGLTVEEEPEAPGESRGLMPPEESRPATPLSRASRRGRSSSFMKYAFPALGILIGGGAVWWYFGLQPSSTGGGGNPSSPPGIRTTRGAGAPGPGTGPGGRANLGLSSSGSRGSSGTAAAGLQIPEPGEALPLSAPSPSPERVREEMARHFDEGRSLLAKGKYQEAVQSFSKVLDLDPANLEAKQQLDEAVSKVLEQKRLEDDLQTAKEFFVEKDYESALRKFYRLPRDRNLGDLDLFIRNAWYDWAVVSMKGGNCAEAVKRLQEALVVDPNDKEAARQQEVAERYKNRPKDRVFYAYVDRLTYRTLDQK